MYVGAPGNLAGIAEPVGGYQIANIEGGPVLPGQPRKVWPRDGSAPGKGGLSFQNLLGGSNLPNSMGQEEELIANAYANKPAGMDSSTYGAIMRQYGTNPSFPGPYTTDDKIKVINWNKGV